jgi:hypothetical protein
VSVSLSIVYIYIYLISALDGGQFSASRPIRFTPGKKPWNLLVRRLDGPQSQCGRYGEVNIHDTTGTRTPTFKLSNPWLFVISTALLRLSRKNTEIYIYCITYRSIWNNNCVLKYRPTWMCCGSVVGIATADGLGDQGVGVGVPVRPRRSFTSPFSRPAMGSTQFPIQWVPRRLSPGVKWQGHETDHSPPTSAEVKQKWISTSTPHTSSWPSA